MSNEKSVSPTVFYSERLRSPIISINRHNLAGEHAYKSVPRRRLIQSSAGRDLYVRLMKGTASPVK